MPEDTPLLLDLLLTDQLWLGLLSAGSNLRSLVFLAFPPLSLLSTTAFLQHVKEFQLVFQCGSFFFAVGLCQCNTEQR